MSSNVTLNTGSAGMQATLWGRGARDWAEFTEPLGSAIFEAAFDDLGIGPGVSLLDIGCGAGLAAALAAARGARVSGLDATPEMLAMFANAAPLERTIADEPRKRRPLVPSSANRQRRWQRWIRGRTEAIPADRASS